MGSVLDFSFLRQGQKAYRMLHMFIIHRQLEMRCCSRPDKLKPALDFNNENSCPYNEYLLHVVLVDKSGSLPMTQSSCAEISFLWSVTGD